MKYIDYIKTAAGQSVDFLGDCMETSFNYVGEIPEASGRVVEIAGNYLETAFEYVGEIPETSGQVTALARDCLLKAPEMSYEITERLMSAASRAAESAGNLVGNMPSYLESLAGSAANYAAAAIALAENYLANREATNNLQWLQKQDDGIYMHGDDGAEMTTDWETLDIPTTPRPRRRYPKGVPRVPPEYLPKGKPKTKKLSPATPPTGGCVSKKMPQMGQFCLRNQYPGNVYQFQWWDNILVRRTWYQHFDFDMQYEAYYKGSPIPMPTTFPPELVADLPKGRYAVTNTWQNSAIENPYGIDSYSRYEGWNWELKFADYASQPHNEWTRTETRTQGNDWVECLGLKYGYSPIFHLFPDLTDKDEAGNKIIDLPTYYHFPGLIDKDVGVSAEGEGRAVHYTTGMIELQYLGADFADVQETPTAAAYLASIGAVEALSFQNISNILGRRLLWGQ